MAYQQSGLGRISVIALMCAALAGVAFFAWGMISDILS
jgi:hypothetical protein